MLDDLQELLKNSKNIHKAMMSSTRDGKYTDFDFPAKIESIKGFNERREYPEQFFNEIIW